MKLDGYTRTCGLFGNPVEHTMSPAIHNTLAREMGLNLVYVPFRVPEGQMRQAVEGAFALNLLGCNVTIPYKSEVIPFLKEIDPLAERIGSVNTLVRQEDGFKGYNTDMPGLYRAMCEDGAEIAGKQVILLGAGGVARAVAILLGEKKAEKVYILNRSPEKAIELAREVNRVYDREIAVGMALAEYETLPDEKFLCIQATNVGMFPKMDEAVIEDPNFYRKISIGYDLIYNPLDTKFMQLVRTAGGQAFNGLMMLLWQGILSFEYWTGTEVSFEQSEIACEEMKQAMGIAKE